jgi:hypothetical protein
VIRLVVVGVAALRDVTAKADRTEISILDFPPTDNIPLTAAKRNCQLGLQCKLLPRAPGGATPTSRQKLLPARQTEYHPRLLVGL